MVQDSTEISKAVKDKHDRKRDVELVLNEQGELVAVPQSQADQIKGMKAGTIATQDYHQL